MPRRLFTLLALLLLAAPLRADDAWYRVQPGDYLLRIAQTFGTTVPALKSANGLRGNLIHPDQRLAIPAPFGRSGEIRWRPPVADPSGEILRPYGDTTESGLTTHHSGVDIAAPRATRVTAPAHGVVRYLGEQEGYGRLMILDHGGGWATVLAPFAETYVTDGQAVVRGDGLGLTGPPVETSRPYLHLELRRDSAAVDPARLLRR